MPDDAAAHDTHMHAHATGPFVSGWRGWRGDPVRVVLVVALAVVGVATAVAVAVLWTDARGSVTNARASELGLASELVTAEVTGVDDAPCSFDDDERCRTFTFALTSGPDDGETVALPELSLAFEQTVPPIDTGDDVILAHEPSTGSYSYSDRDRRSSMWWLAALFAAVVVALGRVRGLLALLGMAATVIVLVAFVAPAVLAGRDPVLVSVVAASAIAFVSLFLTHGISPSSAVALAATLGALGLTLGLSAFFFELASFTGLASEEATLLPLLGDGIDLRGLLLGGAVLGALGALDDVTVTQVATVAELRHQRPDLGRVELAGAGIRVGRAHIASTVNTLLLAYAGASVPLLLLFAASNRSLGLVANSEAVAVEIVRTMCGSIGLVAAVPIATLLAVAASDRTAPQRSAPTPPTARWDDFGPDREFWATD